jgi:hypothetical protein
MKLGNVIILILWIGLVEFTTAAQVPAVVETASISLFEKPQEQLTGVFPVVEYFIRLPEHAVTQSGSTLYLNIRPSPLLLPDVSTLTVSINNVKVHSQRLLEKDVKPQENASVLVKIPLSEGSLQMGWNKVTVEFLLQTTHELCRDVDNPATWVALETGSRLELAYRRIPLFPELSRFPHDFAEEQILHPSSESSMAVFLPTASRDVHLRGIAVLGARLGALEYLRGSHFTFGRVSDWNTASKGRNCVVIGRPEELKGVPIPSDLDARMKTLKQGEGMLAEFIRDNGVAERRCLLVTGSDDVGLEKAILALGNLHAMSTLPSHPWVLTETPPIPAHIEERSKPVQSNILLDTLGVGSISFRGTFRGEHSIQWRLPPGYVLAEGSALNLLVSHSKELLPSTSTIEVAMDGQTIGNIPLTKENVSDSHVRVPLPAGSLGKDPNSLTFRSYLDIGKVDCGHRHEEKAWASILKESRLETQTTKFKVRGLQDLHRSLMLDSFLREAAFLLPANPSLEEIQLLWDVSVQLGRMLPSSPVFWPEVVTYGKNKSPEASRLRDRSILLLGSVPQWSEGLPADTILPICSAAADGSKVQMQAQRFAVTTFEPSLVLAQMVQSPWSKDRWVMMVGGWRNYSGSTTSRLLLDPLVAQRLAGDVSTLDDKGRMATYDSRLKQLETVGNCILRNLPLGASEVETKAQVEKQLVQEKAAKENNFWFVMLCIFVLGGTVSLQMTLMYFRDKRRKKSFVKHEKEKD